MNQFHINFHRYIEILNGYPPVNSQFAIENGPFSSVISLLSSGDFPLLCQRLPEASGNGSFRRDVPWPIHDTM